MTPETEVKEVMGATSGKILPSVGYFRQEFNSYQEALNYLHTVEKEIEEKGVSLWAGNPTRGWTKVVNPVIRQNGAKWALLMDAPQDLEIRTKGQTE